MAASNELLSLLLDPPVFILNDKLIVPLSRGYDKFVRFFCRLVKPL